MIQKISNPVKRKIIQICAFGFCNPHIQNFAGGRLYSGKWKHFCAPGLNCYSCPAATVACPIGSLQAVTGSIKFDMTFYLTGLLLALGVVLGRFICGFLCPFGLIQELLHKIPTPKFHLPKPLRFVKYAVLIIFVLVLPVASTNFVGAGDPTFCKYICPAGTLEGGLPMLATHPELQAVVGWLFALKLSILIIVVIGSIFIMRFFCKILCPLGAIYGLTNKISFYRLKVDEDKCISCGKCARVCPMDVNPTKTPNSAECIRCGRCAHECPVKAIKIGFFK